MECARLCPWRRGFTAASACGGVRRACACAGVRACACACGCAGCAWCVRMQMCSESCGWMTDELCAGGLCGWGKRARARVSGGWRGGRA